MNAPVRERPVDTSMSLLREVADQAMEPGYAVAAASRRTAVTSGRDRPARSPASAATLAVVALVLGLSASVAVAALRAPAPPEAREALLAEIDERRAAIASAEPRVEELRADVDARSTATLSEDGDGPGEAERTSVVLSATTPVRGPGLRLVLDDAPGSRTDAPGGDPRDAVAADQGRVLDRDLHVVTNGLFAAGAEAISVSGHRLTSLSSIRVAGQAILVDYQPLTPPYVVEAVGDPEVMAQTFAGSAAGAYLAALQEAYDVEVTSTAHRRLHLPAGSVEMLRHATASPTDRSAR